MQVKPNNGQTAANGAISTIGALLSFNNHASTKKSQLLTAAFCPVNFLTDGVLATEEAAAAAATLILRQGYQNCMT